MVKFIGVGLLSGVLMLAEYNYQKAVEYTINVAESDMDIVHAMNEYGFQLEDSFDEITEADKVEALFRKEVIK